MLNWSPLSQLPARMVCLWYLVWLTHAKPAPVPPALMPAVRLTTVVAATPGSTTVMGRKSLTHVVGDTVASIEVCHSFS